MGVATILLELSPLALLLHRRALQWLPLGLIALHLGILAASGIFFWKWIVTLVALIVYSTRLHRDAEKNASGESLAKRLFGLRRAHLLAITLPLVLLGDLLFTLVSFAWLDSPVANYFVMRGVGESGATYALPSRFFSPYDLTFHQSRFDYLIDEPVLVGTYGSLANWNLTKQLESANEEDLERLRRDFGQTGRIPALTFYFAHFVARSVAVAQREGAKITWWYGLSPPFHFRTTVPPDSFDFEERLVSVEVTFEEWFWNGTTLRQTRSIPALEVPVPALP